MPASQILKRIYFDKKIEEKEIVEWFLKRLNYPKENLVDLECPDYEVCINNKRVGIEVTKYFSDMTSRGSVWNKKMVNWKKFAIKLKGNLSEWDLYNDYIYGVINFNNDCDYNVLLNKNAVNEFQSILRSIKIKNTLGDFEKIKVNSYPYISKYIDSINFLNTYPEKFLWWDSSLQSGNIIVNPLALQTITDRKIISSSHYKKDYSEKWLIIYAGGLWLTDLYLDLENTSLKIKSDYFTSIFIWDKFSETILHIKPNGSSKVIYPINK